MEGIHGVDVSWLHLSNKEHQRARAHSSPGLARDPPPKTSSHGAHPVRPAHDTPPKPPPVIAKEVPSPSDEPSPTPYAPPSPQQPKATPTKPVISRTVSDKSVIARPDTKRKSSWLSSLSWKFSQSPTQNGTSPAGSPARNATPPRPQSNGPALLTPPPIVNTPKADTKDGEPYVPQAPESGRTSFFSSALRRLSSNSTQGSGSVKPCANGGICPRKVMNVDKQRERCLIPELDQAKLRRVAFCVDVEIAGGPRYKDEEDDKSDKQKRDKDMRLKERAEGDALKNPQSVVEEKGQSVAANIPASSEPASTQDDSNLEESTVDSDKKEISKKKEKKKRSEEERKERKEKKRRRAEENGTVPLELTREENGGSSSPGITTPRDKPTTDPLRIYRRCCQLRETPILKRIADQLSNPENECSEAAGMVATLDLTGSRLQPPDFATLGDWLAIVPVKKIILENAEMTDESVRCVLAGLLAAKVPEHFASQLKRINGDPHAEHKLGVVEKVVLKNNPRLTKEGWKHISLFINMCRSLTAIDLSMIPFPTSPATDDLAVPCATSPDDVAEIFSKSLAERLAGSDLEELLMGECGLTSPDIRKIIDGVTISGVRRLGLAGNLLDDESLNHVTRYLRSGVCEGIDLGGNDLRDRLNKIVASLEPTSKLWGLCLANCNLNPESLKSLFPALVRLPDFRFIDLSHNRDLFSQQPSALVILRKYIPQLTSLKRLHLMDVSLSPEQAIGLAEVLPETPSLAHLNILDNPQLTALASAQDEATQEEACAVYASFMAAARVSTSLIAIDIAVPVPESHEIIKALAKQVVAYCLRNMERFTSEEHDSDVAAAVQSAIDAHSKAMKEVSLPPVLLHLVGHAEGSADHSHDDDPPAPSEDYIVSGNGLIKALQYCLKERETDRKRNSLLIQSGATTPISPIRDSGVVTEHAKSMSKSLLGSARKVRTRLQPALAQEASNPGDGLAYRRLLFVDNVLESMIQRFEDEFPECRTQAGKSDTSDSSRANSVTSSNSVDHPSEVGTQPSLSGSQALNDLSDDEEQRPRLRSRHNSDVSLASRALSMEEGHIHRIGQEVRRNLLRPQTEDHLHGTTGNEPPEHKFIAELRGKLEQMDGEEMRQAALSGTWEAYLEKLGTNKEELKRLQEESPEEYESFKEAQEAAILNSHIHDKAHAPLSSA